jgi:tetratricopeptide (TPR) repeat protein
MRLSPLSGSLTIAVLAVLVASPASLPAQAGHQIPKRPHLKASLDTNSAVSYFFDGAEVLRNDPDRAAADFYWARQIDPTWADPIYGLYAASLLGLSTGRLSEYFRTRWDRKRAADFLSIDSLAWLAKLKNPFVDRRFDGVVLSEWVSRNGGSEADIREAAFQNREMAAWVYYAHGQFMRAASAYAEVIKQHPDEPGLRYERGTAFFAMGLLDSARAEVRSALSMQRAEEANGGIGWASHPFLEFSLGFLYRLADQSDSARAAYERALLDDLAFHPAHRELAITRLATHDTAGALSEYNTAVTLAPTNAGYLYEYGLLLLASNHADSAVVLLKQSIATDPYFASPHYFLGMLYENYGFVPEATGEFTSFVGMAPASLKPNIEVAREHLARLQGDSAKH